MVTARKHHPTVTLESSPHSVGLTGSAPHRSRLSDFDIPLRHTGESHTERVELLNPVNLALECTWTGNRDKPPNITGLWRKDGHEIENSRLTVPLESEQYKLKRVYVTSSVRSSSLHKVLLFFLFFFFCLNT